MKSLILDRINFNCESMAWNLNLKLDKLWWWTQDFGSLISDCRDIKAFSLFSMKNSNKCLNIWGTPLLNSLRGDLSLSKSLSVFWIIYQLWLRPLFIRRDWALSCLATKRLVISVRSSQFFIWWGIMDLTHNLMELI